MHRRQRLSNPRRLLTFLFLTSLTLCLWLGQIPSTTQQVGQAQIASNQTNNVNQLVQQGVELYQVEDFSGAIDYWQKALGIYQNNNDLANQVIILENLARAYQQIGQTNEAINYWEQLITNYRQLEDTQQVGRMQTELAQAYSKSGQHSQAIATLCGTSDPCTEGSALQIARQENDQTGEVAALGSLGEAYRLKGEYDEAIKCLEKASKIDHPLYNFWILNSLGNSHFSQAKLWEQNVDSAQQRGAGKEVEKFRAKAAENYQQALDNFQTGLALARKQNDKLGQMRVLLNLLRFDSQTGVCRDVACNISEQGKTGIDEYLPAALELWQELPNSQYKVYAAIDLAKLKKSNPSLNSASLQNKCTERRLGKQAEELLKEAASLAKTIQHHRSESFALGELGHLYECQQQYNQALKTTKQAILSAEQNLLAKDSLYLWEWQAGRILKAQGKDSEAVNAYEQATTTLEDIRGDLLIASRDLQFDFRDSINPLYRQFAQLELELASLVPSQSEQHDQELDSALETIDSLKLAELQNYFGSDCILTLVSPEKVDELIGENTAVFSSIILDNRTAFLLTLPNGEKRLKWLNIDSKTLREEVKKFRRGLEDTGEIFYDTTQAQKLYNWMITPFMADLNPEQVKTIIFIQDGILRGIPMAALHDGKQFLVEKYAIATTPSLRLTSPENPSCQELLALLLGVSKETTVDEQTFSALPEVISEISQVENQLPGSKKLLNEDFNPQSLDRELKQTVYPVIHIATHGQFGTIPEDTFLVTGNGEKLTITELEAALRRANRGKSVELLALTACQTGVGDDRAALGLAGLAVQAGARSALASLWFVADNSTKILVTEFYKNWLSSDMSKAEALSLAQRQLIKAKEKEEINDQFAHPAFWAPFILIGNWL